MDSYNLIWGVHASENRWLHVDVLRRDWGFRGLVMSDWTSTYSASGIARGGLDLEMPKGWYFNEKELLPLLESGVIRERDLNEKVCHILQTLSAFGCLDRPYDTNRVTEDDPATSSRCCARWGAMPSARRTTCRPRRSWSSATRWG
ncbi:hypothetical protein B5E60_12860 [Alistipes sp. An116]|nr:hypothetical protein B5E60_12860 [Alistipes sp. An116]